MSKPSPILLFTLLAACASAVPDAHAVIRDPAPFRQPLHGLLLRMDQFLHAQEVEGVTRDPRSLGNPPEEIRLTVVPQLLGYRELYRTYPNPIHYRDIVERADYLLYHVSEATSGGATDGMLATALLAAWEVTGDARYREGAQPIIDRAMRLGGFQARLNWGLMSAMALAEYARLTHDAAAAAKASEIVSLVALDQAEDGSFPHYCPGTRDVHYSAWMSMELVLIARSLPDPVVQQCLSRLGGFLHGRIDPQGVTHYQEDLGGGLAAHFYSLGSGCGIDYDTRGWVNELGYLALLFAKRGDARYTPVMNRLWSLEDRGAFADKWAYFPTLEDPIYPWGSSDRSVIRTSVIFWSLASLYAEPTLMASSGPVAADVPMAEGPAPELALAGAMPESDAGASAGAAMEGVWPNPTPGPCDVQFRSVPGEQTRVEVFDATGRRVRALAPASSSRARIHWDGRDEQGARVGRGLYFVRLTGAAGAQTMRVVVAD